MPMRHPPRSHRTSSPATTTAAQRSARFASLRPLRIDGALDEALYRDERPISDFIQVEPDGGQAATERTETWIAFDEDFVYVAFKVWDTAWRT
jgi:hypothetical protein